MGKLLATVGSVTTAARLEKLLRKTKGINSTVIHTPASINGGGCSYSLTTDINNLPLLKATLEETGIQIRKLYKEELVDGEKKYYVIS